jgi:hypothetical protein
MTCGDVAARRAPTIGVNGGIAYSLDEAKGIVLEDIVPRANSVVERNVALYSPGYNEVPRVADHWR